MPFFHYAGSMRSIYPPSYRNSLFVFRYQVLIDRLIKYLFTESKYMNKIKEVLDSQGRTQKWLSEQLGKSFQTISGYCNNHKQPSLEVLFTISEILNVSVKDLIVENK